MTAEQINNAFQKAPESYRKSTEFEGTIVYRDSIFKDISTIDNLDIIDEDTGTKTTKFSGNLNLDTSPALEPLKNLLTLSGLLPVQGLVRDTDPTEIDISAILQNQPLRFMHLFLEAKRMGLFTHYPEDSGLEESRASLICHSTIQGDNPISFDLVAIMTELEDCWNFSFQAEEGQGIPVGDGLAVLPGIAGVDSIDITLPDALNGLLNGLTLQKFTINLNPFQPTLNVNYLAFDVALSGNWDLIPEVFTIENPQLGLLIVGPQNENYLTTPYVKGTFVLGSDDVNLDVEAEFLDNYSATAELREGDLIPVSEAVSHFTSLSGLPTANISELLINVESSGYIFFQGTLETPWTIVDLGQGQAIQLEEVDVILEKNSQEYSSVLVGNLKITDAVKLYLSASYSTGDGWLFSGGTREGESINIGEFISYLSGSFGIEEDQIPASIADISLELLYVEFGTTSKNFLFTCEGTIPIGDSETDEGNQESVDIIIDISLTYGASYSISITGQIIIYLDANNLEDRLEFELNFSYDQETTALIGSYVHPDTRKLILHDLINQFSPSIAVLVPSALEIDLNDALFAIYDSNDQGSGSSGSSSKSKSKFLFSINIGLGMNLSELPLVGDLFPEDQMVGIENFQVIVTSQKFQKKEVIDLNQLLPEGITRLLSSSQQEITKGVSIGAYLVIGDMYQETLFVPVVDKSSPSPSPSPSPSKPPSPSPSPSKPGTNRSSLALSSEISETTTGKKSLITIADNGVWLELERAFGPIYFNKVGLQYRKSEIHFAPEIALIFSTYSFFLNEVSVSSPLTEFSPSFNLDGFELEYQSGAIDISGAFLRYQYEDYDEYSGMGLLKLSFGSKSLLNIGLSAIAAYADTEDGSFFLYAVLDFPMGGLPFLFFTGASAGFGYNYDLYVPPIEEISQFPLVAQAIEGQYDWNTDDISGTVNSQLEELHDYITVSAGAGFLAMGIKFTSFKLLDCFGLLTVAVDNAFEMNLIGSASFIVPSATKKVHLIYMQMFMKTTFSTKEGLVSMEAQVAEGSYIFSKSCHLTGGYAAYIWFAGEYEGDFVISLGGYHPYYQPPSHYPAVPRIGCNWKLGPMAIRGEIYVALCAHAIMAGGYWGCEFRAGPAYASFSVYADFLICWKPYHYDIGIGINAKAGFGFLGPLQVGTDLRMWGPDFGGFAKIHVILFSFNIKWGDQSSQYPIAIDWDEFKESFLLKEEEGEGEGEGEQAGEGEQEEREVCNIAINEGLFKDIKNSREEISIVNPKKFEILTDSLIPFQTATQGDNDAAVDTGDANTVFGIHPMAVKGEDLISTYKVIVTLKGDGNHQEDVTTDIFTLEPVTKRFPTNVWGEPQDYESSNKVVKPPETNEPAFVENVLSGFRVVPKVQPPVGNTEDIEALTLQYDVNPISQAYVWNNIVSFVGHSTEEGRETIKDSVVDNSERNSILTALGFDPSTDVDVSDSVADDFVIAPQVQ